MNTWSPNRERLYVNVVYPVDMNSQQANGWFQFSCPKCDRDGALEVLDGVPTGRVRCDRHGVFYMTQAQLVKVRRLDA